jgi:hypothetical protein
MAATLLKGFTHDGKVYQQGDEFEGTPGEVQLLARQHYVKTPVESEPKPAEPPAPAKPTKATLLKGFAHDGRVYAKGDEFDGTPYELELLARQDYVKLPAEGEPKHADHTEHVDHLSAAKKK